MKAISVLLGSKPFLFGDKPCLADAVLFSFINCLVGLPEDSRSEMKQYLHQLEEVSSLLKHFERMKELYWPDYDTCRSD